jgi:hypothetical protein
LPVPLIINNITYQYPRLGDENWGQDATNWAVGITQLVNSIDTLVTTTIGSGVYTFTDSVGVTNPPLRFQNNLTTGLYLANTNTIGFAANATSVGTVDSTGLWTLDTLSVTNNTTLTTVDVDQINANGYVVDALASATLTDNTSGTVFQFAVADNKNIIVEYSLTRSTGKETGQIIMSSNGTTVQVSGQASTLVDCGVSFSGDVNSGNIRLLYTTTSTGSNATMKYVTKRWND